jgi:radical SAM superfamily enzyme YgiQ (UPF0313 family)
MRVLLVSTYELGHQPITLASPAAALRADGHDVRCLDTSVEAWESALVDWAEAVAFSVPMHTAMRLAVARARTVRAAHPDLPVAFYGLYAPVSRDHVVGSVADAVFAGTYEPALRAWVRSLPGAGLDTDGRRSGAASDGSPPPLISLERPRPELPARDLLPPLDRYAKLAVGDLRRLAGAVETTQGCLHTCRHCPVPTVYGGRFRAVPLPVVLDDIAQLVELGAEHITFADPDFLNGPTHALRTVTAMHERWPHLTFDCTTKVDHILDHAEVWGTFAASGCLFVVSAFETLDDELLARLDKGHTATQAGEVVRLLRHHGIEVRPSWLPFTPWTRLEDVAEILAFVAEYDLIGNVEPVQYTIRLLIPEGSLLLDDPSLARFLGPYDPERLTYPWTAADERVDELQAELARLVEERTDAGTSITETFEDIDAAVRRALRRAGRTSPQRLPLTVGASVGAQGSLPSAPAPRAATVTEARPRLTEPWFCCAEPTESMTAEKTPDQAVVGGC